MDRTNISELSRHLYSNTRMWDKYLHEYDKSGHKSRILLIDVKCKTSSTGKIVYDLYNAIRNDGRQAAICYGRGPAVEGDNIYKFGLDWETCVHALMARLTGLNGYFSYISTRRLINYIEAYSPDLIHIHELHAYFVNIRQLLEYIKSKKIPVVWTFHCEYMYTGKCGHAYECKGFQKNCGECPMIKEYPKSFWFDRTKTMLAMKKKLLSNLDFSIVTPSQWLADRVKISFLKNKEIRVINNGVNTEIYRPIEADSLRKGLGISPDSKVVLFVAPFVMDKRKGGHWAIRIAEEMTNTNVVFVMVGGGTKPAKIPSNVKFVGQINNEDLMAKYYSMADVFLLCSEKETYSMPCAEALCCGTPVVGFMAGAPETIFKEAAVFVEYGDTEAMKSEIIKWMKN